MNVIFDHKNIIAPSIITFWFKPNRPVNYTAGQFTEIRLPHKDMDDRGDKRWFTISSSPTDPLLSITTRFTNEKGSSFKRKLMDIVPGTKLVLAEPMGDFVLPKDKTIPLLFVAAGMGITPVHSMIKWLKDGGEQRNVNLIFAVNKVEDLVWQDLFMKYDLSFLPIIKTPFPGWRGQTGSLSALQIVKAAHKDPGSLIYLTGPESMTEKFAKQLPGLGIDKRRLVTDYFPGYEKI